MRFRLDSAPGSNKRFRRLGYFNLSVFVIAASVLLPMRAWTVPPKDFLLIAWNQGQQLLQHGTVDLAYPYPLWTQIVLFPFALLAPETGAQLWFFCSLSLLSASIFLLFDLFHWPLRLPLVVFTSLFVGAFGPVFTTLWVGQLNFVSLFSLVLAARAVQSGSWFLAGSALGLSLIKPQLTFLVVAGLLAAALWERCWRLFAGFGAVLLLLIAASAPFALTPLQIFGAGIPDHLAMYLPHTSTLWGLSLTLAPNAAWLAAVLSALLLFWLAYLWLDAFRSGCWRECVFYLMSVSTIVNLLVVPYSWFYNQAVLILPVFWAVDQIRVRAGAARAAWLIAIILVAYFVPTGVDAAFTRIYLSEVYQVIPVLFILPLVVLLQWQTERIFQPAAQKYPSHFLSTLAHVFSDRKIQLPEKAEAQ